MNKLRVLSLSCLLLLGLGGCASQQIGSKSSVVEYLYPKEDAPVVQPSIPVLKLPIKLGVAFVPEQASLGGGTNFWTGRSFGSEGLTETRKMEILERIASHFKAQKFIGEIQTIPSAYLTPGGSFTNLDQIKTMYGVDVIALVSYDQVQFTDEGMLSLSYWTIVGAYLISGQKNDTNTLIDTVVYDIESRKMLFRAPGTSIVKGRSTPVNLTEELRDDSVKGFELSTNEMIKNLDVQLAAFREKAKQRPEEIKVVRSSGYSGGGGAMEWVSILLLGALLFTRRRNKSIVGK